MSRLPVVGGDSGTWGTVLNDYLTVVVTSTQTASYTLTATDAGTLVEMNVATANNLTVPPDSVNLPIGTVVCGSQEGVGITTIVAGSGVTVNSRGQIKTTAAQYAEFTLRKRAANDWRLSGDLA